MSATNWLSDFHAARSDANADVAELISLANAFQRTGQQTTADEIRFLANSIRTSIQAMEHAIARNINESFDEAQRQTWGTLGAIVEMATKQVP